MKQHEIKTTYNNPVTHRDIKVYKRACLLFIFNFDGKIKVSVEKFSTVIDINTISSAEDLTHCKRC